MSKIQTSLLIDSDVFLELKRTKANVSKLCNDFLRTYTDIKIANYDKTENELYAEYEKTQAKALMLKNKADKVKADRIERDGTVRYID